MKKRMFKHIHSTSSSSPFHITSPLVTTPTTTTSSSTNNNMLCAGISRPRTGNIPTIRIIVVGVEFATGARVEATPVTATIARTVTMSVIPTTANEIPRIFTLRQRIPLDGLQGGILRQQCRREGEASAIDGHLLRHGLQTLLLLGHEQSLAFLRLFVEERFDADTARLGAEVPPQCVGTCEPTTAAPRPAVGELTAADELFLAGMEALVAFAVVLASECFAADGADEGALVGVGAEMGTKVVGACEALGAEIALEGGGVFLDALAVGGYCARTPGVSEVKNVVTMGNARSGRTAGFRIGRCVS